MSIATTSQLRTASLITLVLTASAVIIAAVAIAVALQELSDDARLINMAGRQRMLSQRITKNILLIRLDTNSVQRRWLHRNLSNLIEQWEGAQEYLSGVRPAARRSREITELFVKQQGSHQELVAIGMQIVADSMMATPVTANRLNSVLASEATFLDLQERITARFEIEAASKLKTMASIATVSVVLLLIVIVAEWLFIIRPAIRGAEEMQRKLISSVVDTEESERSRIAADLHDGIGPILAVMKMQAESEDIPANERLADVVGSIDHVAAEIRALAHNLVPAALQGCGLQETLEGELSDIQRSTGVAITFTSSDMHLRLPKKMEIALYRITQELINNAVRHGKATQLSVSLAATAEAVLFSVSDNGRGFDAATISRGRGLWNVHSRVNAFNGNVSVSSSTGRGTTVHITIPLPSTS